MGFATAAMGMNAVSQASTAYAQGQALKAQGAYRRNVADMNAATAEKAAKDAIQIGGYQANVQRNKGAQLEGKQKAALAAQGIDIDSGDAAELLQDSRAMSEMDALNINNKAYAEAFGFKQQATAMTNEGKLAQATANANAKSTVLTGGMQALNTGVAAYGNYRDRKAGLTAAAAKG